ELTARHPEAERSEAASRSRAVEPLRFGSSAARLTLITLIVHSRRSLWPIHAQRSDSLRAYSFTAEANLQASRPIRSLPSTVGFPSTMAGTARPGPFFAT